MKSISLLLLSVFFFQGHSNAQNPSRDLLSNIFTNTYRQSIISKGDNLPDFDRKKDSINLFLVALHERFEPADFQKKAGWSEEKLKANTQFLINKGWLVDDGKRLKPSVFIATDRQGAELYNYGKPLASAIAKSIEKEIPLIRNKLQAAGLSSQCNFDTNSFLILSNVLLDNWQIMEVEANYLKKENRPMRHGKFYYASIMENADIKSEPFGIYGNQYGKINDTTYMSIYGNNRNVVNERLKSDIIFRDSIFKNSLIITTELRRFFEVIAKDFRPTLLNILKDYSEYSHKVYEDTGYSDEIAFEEFFIWWYHFIYTSATNILAEGNHLVIPQEGNFYYR